MLAGQIVLIFNMEIIIHAALYKGFLWAAARVLSVKVLCTLSRSTDDRPKVWYMMLSHTAGLKSPFA